MENKKSINAFLIVISIILVASLGSVFVNRGMEWFNELAKPTQWIPNFVIPLVWTVLYFDFAITLIIMSNKDLLTKEITILSVLNGVLNILWCLVFFTLKLTFVGNIVIILNLIFSFCLILSINKVCKTCALATIIYPIWISIATTLNLALWIMN